MLLYLVIIIIIYLDSTLKVNIYKLTVIFCDRFLVGVCKYRELFL